MRSLQGAHCGEEFFRAMTIGAAVLALAMVKSFFTAEEVDARER